MAYSIYFSDRKLAEKWDPDKILEFVYWFKISLFLKLYTHSYAKNTCNLIWKINVFANKQADKKWETDIWLYLGFLIQEWLLMKIKVLKFFPKHRCGLKLYSLIK